MAYSAGPFKSKFHLVPHHQLGLVSAGGIGGRVGCAWAVGTTRRYIDRDFSRQFFGYGWCAWFAHRRRNFRIRIAGRHVRRRFGRRARRCRRNLGRIDWHRCNNGAGALRFPAGTAYEHRVAARFRRDRITARNHVGDAVALPFVF